MMIQERENLTSPLRDSVLPIASRITLTDPKNTHSLQSGANKFAAYQDNHSPLDGSLLCVSGDLCTATDFTANWNEDTNTPRYLSELAKVVEI